MADTGQTILIPDFLTVRQLAELIGANPIDVMKTLIGNGIMASINQVVDYDTAAIVVEEMGYSATSESEVAAQEQEQQRVEENARKWEVMYAGEDTRDLVARNPVVTILGHVDHGKTTLLDTIRSAHVAEGEAGGITQHIGAYRASHEGRVITFLDTPGHEAFTAMRARGAQGADIAILVVAADDGVMPTTREALNHVRAANVPVVVAITKVDKANANPDRVKQQLADLGLTPDDWDGDTLMVQVAATAGLGLDDLIEAVLLVADDMSITANPAGTPRGTVLESRIDRQRGTITTLLIMNGTLRASDMVVAGSSYGRIKAMFDEIGNPVQEAPPSMPVSVLGFDHPPEPGTRFERVRNEREARALVAENVEASATPERAAVLPTLEDLFKQVQGGKTKELALIIKTDVQGSLQPIVDSLMEMSGTNDEGIEIRILLADAGAVSESDVMLASASKAIVIGFNVRPDNAAIATSDALGVDIRSYSVIYKLLEDIELALAGLLDPKYEKKVIGRAEVRQVFKIPKIGVIAGSYILSGEARRNAKARVLRKDKVLVEESGISSLRRFDDDVREVRQGFECGVTLSQFSDFEAGDIVEFFVMERVS
jgi:translation initiation factor IF-2